MKTIKPFVACFLGLSAFVSVAFAQGQQVKNEINALRTQFDQQRQQALQELEKQKQAFQQQIQQKRTEIQQQIEQKRTVLKEEVAKIKNQKKQDILSRVYESINELNKRMTDQFQKALDQLSDVLLRIQTRADTAKANGKDVSAVQAAIAKATDAITAAKTAVTAQTGKVYSFQIRSDATFKKDVGQARQTLHADLVKVRDALKAARDAVHQAAVALSQISGVDELKPPANNQQSKP